MQVDYHKHLGFILDSKMSYSKHIDGKIGKANQGIGVIKRLYDYLPGKTLLQIYKSFIRPHLDYCDVIYHKPTYDDFYSNYYSERATSDPININYEFTNKIKSVQYNAALAITGCVQGTSRGKRFLELALRSLCDRRRLHRLTLIYKILNDLTPQYLTRFIPNCIRRLQSTRTNREETMPTRTLKFQYTFFPDTLNSWDHLSSFIKSSISLNVFKKRLMEFLMSPLTLYMGGADPEETN